MITLHSNIIEDEYTEYIRNTYDLDPQKANSVSVPSLVLPKAWNIIAVIGASGSGKSTILNQLGGAQKAHFDERPVISNLGLPPKEAAACFVAQWDDKPVAFCAVLPLPSGTIKNAVRATRSVVLPDYQGLGIGSKLTDTIAGIYKAAGKDFYTKTINPALGLHREHSPLWEASAKNHRYQKNNESYIDSNGRKYLSRPSYCHHYIGPAIFGFENLVLPIDTIRRERSLQGQLSLF